MPAMAMSETVLQLNSTFSVTVFSVHPILTPKPLNMEQIATVVERVKATQGPILLMGDWNAVMSHSLAIQTHLLQIWEIEGIRHAFNPRNDSAYEYPITRPDSNSRIDHVFYRGLPDPISAEVMQDEVFSDHLGLKVVFPA